MTAQGGGVVFSQGAHQVDIVRLLGGGKRAQRARADRTLGSGAADRRRVRGARSTFAERRVRVARLQRLRAFRRRRVLRRHRRAGRAQDRGALWRGSPQPRAGRGRRRGGRCSRQRRNYGGAGSRAARRRRRTLLRTSISASCIVSCERADLRPLPTGVMIYGDAEARSSRCRRRAIPRAEVIDELYAAVVDGSAPLHDGRWGMATLEVCLAMLRIGARAPRHRAARTGRGAAVGRRDDAQGADLSARPDWRTSSRMRCGRSTARCRCASPHHEVSIGHWPFLRALWEADGLTQRELSRRGGRDGAHDVRRAQGDGAARLHRAAAGAPATGASGRSF